MAPGDQRPALGREDYLHEAAAPFPRRPPPGLPLRVVHRPDRRRVGLEWPNVPTAEHHERHGAHRARQAVQGLVEMVPSPPPLTSRPNPNVRQTTLDVSVPNELNPNAR